MTNWQAGFVLAAILQSIVLGGAHIRATERRSNLSLATLLFVLAGMLLVYPMGWHGRGEVPVWLAFFPLNLPLAVGPLLYLHVRSVSQTDIPRPWLHAVPVVLQLAYLAMLSMLPTEIAFEWKEQVHDDVVKPVVEWTVLLSMAGYAAAGLFVLRNYRTRLRAERSDADRHDGRWLSHLLATLLAATAVLGGVRTYTTFVGEIDNAVWFLWFSIWSMWLGVAGWRRAGRPLPQLAPTQREPAVDARDWSTLGAEWQKLTMEHGWWREPDLTLATLARRLGTNTLYLSRAINEGLGMNFNEMINLLRTEEVARRLRGDAEGGLTEIALEAGFSSKATFNRAFRSQFGMSPTSYRSQIAQREEAARRSTMEVQADLPSKVSNTNGDVVKS